jgi:hypothetical protein
MAPPWKARLSAVGQGLLTLEINTVVTVGLSAQKMPEVPLALHSLVQVYNDYLCSAGFDVTEALLDRSACRVRGLNEAATVDGAKLLLRELQSWPFPGKRVWTDVERKATLDQTAHATAAGSMPATDLTNGAETFEALQWAAWAALQTARAGGSLPASTAPVVLSRIYANCRQLKEAALRLEQQHIAAGTAQSATWRLFRKVSSAPASKERLGALIARRGMAATSSAPTESRLFGATVEQTARALFEHPRPVYDVDPDVTILIRKAWDIGVQHVCMQTVLQIDGDLLQVVGDMRPEERIFLTPLHKQAVTDSITQWRSLFDLIRQLAGEIGSVVFGA